MTYDHDTADPETTALFESCPNQRRANPLPLTDRRHGYRPGPSPISKPSWSSATVTGENQMCPTTPSSSATSEMMGCALSRTRSTILGSSSPPNASRFTCLMLSRSAAVSVLIRIGFRLRILLPAEVRTKRVAQGRGVVKAWLMNGYEVQVDLGTGRVLQTAYRRSDVIETIHDGSFFGGDWTKLGLFLPAGLTMLLLWVGGMWMWWVPFIAKRRRARARRS